MDTDRVYKNTDLISASGKAVCVHSRDLGKTGKKRKRDSTAQEENQTINLMVKCSLRV